jgi:hypothetical protein
MDFGFEIHCQDLCVGGGTHAEFLPSGTSGQPALCPVNIDRRVIGVVCVRDVAVARAVR